MNNENTRSKGEEDHTLRCVGGLGEKRCGVGKLERNNMGEMPDIGDGGMEAANHIAMYVPMQQSFMICTCTPELEYNKKNYPVSSTAL